jgi:hypothetical protein
MLNVVILSVVAPLRQNFNKDKLTHEDFYSIRAKANVIKRFYP